MPKCCSYCESENHNISACPVDNDMDKLLDSTIEPNFNNLSLKVLKKIAALTGLKTSMPKVQLVLTFKRTWLMRQKANREEVDILKKEISAIKTQQQQQSKQTSEQPDECPICMDSIGQVNSSVTKCGHKFCSTCFIKTAMRKNSCPMCRASLVDENEYNRYMYLYLEERVPIPTPTPTMSVPIVPMTPIPIPRYMRNVPRRLPINRRQNTNTNSQEHVEEVSHIILDGEGDDETIMTSILDNLDNTFDDDMTIDYSNDNPDDDLFADMPSLITADDETVSEVTNATTSAAAAAPEPAATDSLSSTMPSSSYTSHLDMDDTIREILLNLDNHNYPGPFPQITPNVSAIVSASATVNASLFDHSSTNHITIGRPWNSSRDGLESISSSFIPQYDTVPPYGASSTSIIRNPIMRRNRRRMTIGVTPITHP